MTDADQPVVFEGVTLGYGGKPVLDGLSMRVERGAVYALLGRNGEGKTTAVRALLGLEPVTAGRVLLGGIDPWRRRVAALARVGFVPEEPDAPPALTAPALGRLAGALARRWDAAGYAAQLGRAGVPLDQPFARLSRGQKAHVGLALAVATRPELLVLDDPTLGLDLVARRAFYGELIGQLTDGGVTILLTTHDIAAVERIATHVGVLRGGKLVVDTELEALKAGFRRVRFDDPEGREVEAIVADFEEAKVDRWLAKSGRRNVEVASMSLEEIFAEVTETKEVA